MPIEGIEKLKAILLDSDREKVRLLEEELNKLRRRLEDKERLIATLDPVIAHVLSRKIHDSRTEMAEAIAPVIGPAIKKQITDAKDEVADALYPVIGKTIRKAVAEAMKNLAHSVNQRIDKALSFGILRKRIQAKLKGIPPEQLLLSESLPFSIHEIFYIHKKSGILLTHFSAPGQAHKAQEDLLSGMLTAIRNFAQDAFQSDSERDLNVIEYDDLQIYIEDGRYAYLAFVIEGVVPKDFYDRLHNFEAQIHRTYADQLRNFSGDTTPFTNLNPQFKDLIEYFSTKTDQNGKKSKTGRYIFYSLALLFILFILFRFFSGPSVENRKVDKPAEVRIDRSQIIQHLSTLNPPLKTDVNALHFIVDRSALFLEGKTASMGEALLIAREIAAFNHIPVVVNRLQPEVGDPIPYEKIRKLRIYFDNRSVRLNEDEKSKLSFLLSLKAALQNHKIIIRGFSDRTGSESVNKKISEERARSVKLYLEQMGYTADQIEIVAMGSTHPEFSTDYPNNQAKNRRVTLEIR